MGTFYSTQKKAKFFPPLPFSNQSLQHLASYAKCFKFGFDSISGAVYFDNDFEYAFKYFKKGKKEKKIYDTEVNAYSRLQELNIDFVPKVYETLTTSDGSYILMEYCGRDLCNIGKLQYQSWARIVEFLFSSLDKLHVNGITHGDIKSENIMINSFQSLKLIDLGFTSQNKLCTGVGTIPFITPYNRDPVQNDKYAAALTLIELAGQPHTDVEACCLYSEQLCDDCFNTKTQLTYARINIQQLLKIREPKLLVELIDIVMTQLDITREFIIWNRNSQRFHYGNKLHEKLERREDDLNRAWDKAKISVLEKTSDVIKT